MPSPVFEFFEIVAEELSVLRTRVLTRVHLQTNDDQAPLFDDLKLSLGVGTTEEAVSIAIDILREHFERRGSALPFTYEAASGRFFASDIDYLCFVTELRSMRSIGSRSRDFECSVAEKLFLKTTGAVHRVGFPRDEKKKKAEFNRHLSGLGFQKTVLFGSEKDGGFDILWLLPLGAVPHSPIVSVQCKNGEFDMATADSSVGAGTRSLGQHKGLQSQVHVPCVLFNDYVQPDRLTSKQLNFVPLGLSDLSPIKQPRSLEKI